MGFLNCNSYNSSTGTHTNCYTRYLYRYIIHRVSEHLAYKATLRQKFQNFEPSSQTTNQRVGG